MQKGVYYFGILGIVMVIILIAFLGRNVFTWPSTIVPICTAEGNQEYPYTYLITGSRCAISDGDGGAIFTWQDWRSYPDIYARRIDRNGNVLWEEDGILVSTVTDGRHPQLVIDGAGGAVIAWYSDHAIYAQRIDGNGSLLWEPGGVRVSSSFVDLAIPQLATDGTGGAIIAWNNVYDILAQRIDGSGIVPWEEDVPICTADGVRGEPQSIADGVGGAIMTWEDMRRGIMRVKRISMLRGLIKTAMFFGYRMASQFAQWREAKIDQSWSQPALEKLS